ncbi:hypothetical protein RJ55_01264 [Drechmeria coniospora]|nr:hypothetical protein RJ55_01264 [Drechmeria coniospora]
MAPTGGVLEHNPGPRRSTLHHCLRSRNHVNLIIGSKQPTAVYLSPEEAADHCRRGAGVWKFASSQEGRRCPDVVLVGIGVEVTFEVVKAAELLRDLAPELKLRVVNVADLLVLAAESRHPHALSDASFIELLSEYKPICFNYHGYATELQGLLFRRPGLHRITVEGYKEEGSTTTPFDMMMANRVSRFDLAIRALDAAAGQNDSVRQRLGHLRGTVDQRMKEVKRSIGLHGQDPDDLYNMPRFK